jgi:aspartyl-tRNA(Asn)/glutamyl-tRNA(Gln) amidotransferase subunit C
MPESGEIDVAHVARLARLNLTEEETKTFQEQLRRVLEYAEKLREPDTSQVETTAHAAPVYDVLRDDEPRPWFTAEEALSNAPRQANDLFVVPKVVE